MKTRLSNKKINFQINNFFCFLLMTQVLFIISIKINHKWNIESSLNFWKSYLNLSPSKRILNDFSFENSKNKTNNNLDNDYHINNHSSQSAHQEKNPKIQKNQHKEDSDHKADHPHKEDIHQKENSHHKIETHNKEDSHHKIDSHSSINKALATGNFTNITEKDLKHEKKKNFTSLENDGHENKFTNQTNEIHYINHENSSNTEENKNLSAESKINEEKNKKEMGDEEKTNHADQNTSESISKINNTPEIKNNPTLSTINDMKEIKQTLERTSKFNMFFEQIKAHESRQNELRNEVNDKLRNIQDSEKKIVKLILNILIFTYIMNLKIKNFFLFISFIFMKNFFFNIISYLDSFIYKVYLARTL